jgi:pentatricopeptide repeat protein
LWNSLISAYAKCGDYEKVEQFFQEMPSSLVNYRTWCTMFAACSYTEGHLEKALELYKDLKIKGLEIDEYIWGSLFSVCAINADLKTLKELHQELLDSKQQITSVLWNSLISAYFKCGNHETATQLFQEMPPSLKNNRTWCIMIASYGNFRLIREAVALFEEMQQRGCKVDTIVLGAILHAYSHGILPDDAINLYNSMEQQFGVIPDERHQAILIDALGRAGRLEEAEHMAASQPRNIIFWITLLGACRLHNDKARAERALSYIHQINPQEASSYVLMANIQGAMGKWEEQAQTIQLMKTRGAKKIPGKSWIVLNKKIHTFVAHETNHPAMPAINAMKTSILERLKSKFGYKADISWVSKDIADHLKENDLCEHSERYALSYGLLNPPSEGPLVIFKNLRVCGDCHTYTALISKAFNLEIRLRDASVWHIFKDGKCICHNKY